MGATLDRSCLDEIIKRGGWAAKTHGSQHQKGIPDIVGTYKGRSLWLENKAGSDVLSAVQRSILRKIRRTDPLVVADVVRSVEYLKEILDAIDRGELWVGVEL